MMKKYIVAICALMTALSGFAQNPPATRWEGVNVGNQNGNGLTNSGHYYLYNVGLGRMVTNGGDWGIQARLFYDLSGMQFTWKQVSTSGYFTSPISTDATATVLGCNVPEKTSGQTWPDNSATFTLILDARSNYSAGQTSGTRQVHFVPVGDGTNTYYIYETIGTGDNNKYWWGAVYGKNDGKHEGDPNGELVLLSSSFDKMTWSQADPTAATATAYLCGMKNVEGGYGYTLLPGDSTLMRSMDSEVVVFNADTKIPLRNLYKWRIVSEAQFLDMINSVGDVTNGASADLTSYIYDNDFSRNNWDFFETPAGWSANRFSDVTYASGNSNLRYGYTWGYYSSTKTGTSPNITYSKTNNQTNPQKSTPWNEPVRLKAQWDSKNQAKYGILEFEGVGTASTYVDVQNDGSYSVRAYGF